ncbi:MAG: hypothetical protein E6J20_21270 [Chloroflexi bacterium]|nr:MAG: hypothetical protein E6J20_21270 [Chloroflexota bacterium]
MIRPPPRSHRRAAALVAALLLAACADATTTITPRLSQPAAPAATPAPGTAASGVAPSPAPVLLVVMENRGYADVVGAAAWPFLNGLIARGGLATAMYATTHPSLPNYLELITGTTAGITSDCTGCSVETPTLVDQLRQHGLDWRAYMEGAGGPCPTDRVVPFDGFAGAVATGALPAFTWVTPNLCDDGHDCDGTVADAWLRDTLTPVLASPWYRAGGIVVVTWDEGGDDAGCCGGAAGGHIATVVVSTAVRAGSRLAAPADQAGLLRALEDHFGVGHLGDAADPRSGSLLPLLQA